MKIATWNVNSLTARLQHVLDWLIANPVDVLSDREFEVFRLLVVGDAVSDIAAKLNLSVKTVSTHKANLMQKIGVGNHSELIRYALRHGLTDLL